MFWVITAVISGLGTLFFMSKVILHLFERTEEVEDPVWLTVLEVDRLGDEIARWETNLWSLWTVALVENLLYRLDDPADKTIYLGKLAAQITELECAAWEARSKSEKTLFYPYFDEKTDDSPTP